MEYDVDMRKLQIHVELSYLYEGHNKGWIHCCYGPIKVFTGDTHCSHFIDTH